MTTLTNSFEGGTNGTALTQGSGGNTGGTSGNFFDAITIGTSATLAFDNTQAAHGTLACKNATGGTSTTAFAEWAGSLTGTSIAQVWYRAYLFFTANPSSNTRIVSVLNGATVVGSVLLNTSGKLITTNTAGGTVTTTTATVPLNAWFRIEGYFLTSAGNNAGQVELKLFTTSADASSADETDTSAANVVNSTAITRIRFGVSAALLNSPAYWFDDVGASDTAYLGPAAGTDPLTLAWGAGGTYWHLYNTAADGTSRREVPAQRAYVSVPGAVDSPANPLTPPLDTAWQSDGRYHHLYNDSHLRDRRQYFTQRPLVSDPNLLQPAGNADPLALNPEQSDSSDLWRVAAVPAFYDRREVPQQRQYYDLSLLATALLENELLGGGDTARHAWWQRPPAWPQQRPYISDPSFYPVQQQIGAGTTEAWWGVATDDFYGQRPYISDPSFYPQPNALDPLLAGEGLLDVHQHQAATHADRREVPQQRAYISDPSFYPTVAPTDPLTVAWGAGGAYWHLYNRAGDITDRREVPQQRAYISDPLLLTTALLESPFLGGGDTGRHCTWFTDRREVPAQRLYLAAVDVPLDPVLAAFADLARRYGLPFTHADRREVPQQRTYFPVPPPPPAVVNATSSPTVSAPDASGAAVTGSGSTSLVTAGAASAPGVSDG